MDHVPVAVGDLEQARADFEKLGFVLKPGRPHTDSIRNVHVKFRDGTEIELITASAPLDALSAEYIDWLKAGDGPAFWSLYNPDLQDLTERLSKMGLSPNNEGHVVTFPQSVFAHRLFFAERLWSPTDQPEYFAHPNTAYRLEAVWLAGAAKERDLVLSLGGDRRTAFTCAPFSPHVEVLTSPNGDEIMFISEQSGKSPERSILGVTVMVRSLDAVHMILAKNNIHDTKVDGCSRNSIWVEPADAHGLWIEFRR
ncbi:hypothetical protein FHS83_000811 [Rhizomicrobium palustre]|uniref:Glyoxalase-like domain-containing protein n=1 Tax=Rhizomicrobium palustre TaxID=189966 RepID=A0A846MVV8_9PROT|nr:hypothetical protein [Rhizomicrobium palustre]